VARHARAGLAIRLFAAILIWTAVSYALVTTFPRTGVCGILQTHEPGVAPHPITQAEMDAQVARCNRPDITILGVAVAGYIAIGAWTLMSVLSPSDPDRSERRARR